MKFVILGSGRGSNAEAILRAWQAGALGKAEPVAVFSDQPQAGILSVAERAGIPGRYLDPGKFRTKFDAEAELRWVEAILATGAQWVVLAGLMRVLKSNFLNAFPMRIINLHPSLLPSFKGLAAIQQAFEYGVRYTGCTVHLVTEALDGGPILDQAVVRVEADDTLATLTEKVHRAEHELLPRVIADLAQRTTG